MKHFVVGFVFFCLPFLVWPQTIESNENENDLFDPVAETLNVESIFDDEEALDLTLKYDITAFIKNKQKGEYLPAELTIHINENESIVKEIRLKARGNFRRGHCFFPPIYLNFKTDPIENTDLAGIKKIKMVTHCSSGKSADGYIMKEYLAYKLYNQITENSFRVKLLNINYIDTGKKERNYQRRGFLIEPLDLLIKRTNSVEIQPEYVREEHALQFETDLVALFEYLIANTDWRIKGGHNMKYIKSLTSVTPQVIPVPYDFDYSGFVGTHYSFPQEWTSIDDVTEREYLGYCRQDEEDYRRAIEVYREKQDEIIENIQNFEYLDHREKKNLISFCDEFFRLVNDPNSFVSILSQECRTDF